MNARCRAFAGAMIATICVSAAAETVMPDSLRRELDVGSTQRALAVLKHHPTLIRSRSAQYEETPLHLASQRGRTELVRWLCRRHAPLNDRCYNDFTPLHLAANGEIAAILVKAGADVHARDASGYTPMQFAARDGWADRIGVVMAIRKSGEPLDIISALFLGKRDEARKLIRANPKVARSIWVDDGTPLHIAAAGGDLETVRLLLKIGLKVDAEPGVTGESSGAGYTALVAAGVKGRVKMVEFLLEQGADPDKALSFRVNGPTRNPNGSPFDPEIEKLLMRYADARRK